MIDCNSYMNVYNIHVYCKNKSASADAPIDIE